MNKIEQPEAPGHGSRKSAVGERGARADTAEIVLLLVTILTLMGVAAGIAIGFPMALEVVAVQANAATTVSPAPHGRPPHRHQEYSAHRIGRGASPGVASPDTGAPAPPLDARNGLQPQEKIEEDDEPLIVDDVRSDERMYAAAQATALFDRSIPQPSATHR